MEYMKMTDNREYLVALCSYSYFGPQRIKLLLNYFGNPKKAWKASLSELKEIGLKEAKAAEFLKFKKDFENGDYFNRLKKFKIEYVTFNDKNYPENLKEINDFPPVLYYIGSLRRSDKNAVAIVGSRLGSSYGREVTENISAELSSLGIVIVSGLALGIDAVAHKACFEAGGRGIVVLASGLDTISPFTNRWIAIEIVKHGGAIVSEYPLGFMPLKTNFPARNRIVSGLSKAVIVVEGLKKSGTLLTASAAAEQGRTVFAVPGQITSPLSQAPNYLIQNGAKLVSSTQDILDELNLQLKVDADEMEKVLPGNENEVNLVAALTNEALHLDELARITGLTVSQISASLTVMELKGLVKNIGQGMYRKI
jgi:DNA processing protein